MISKTLLEIRSSNLIQQIFSEHFINAITRKSDWDILRLVFVLNSFFLNLIGLATHLVTECLDMPGVLPGRAWRQ